MSDQYWNMVHQNWKRGCRHTAWLREISHYCCAHVIRGITDHKDIVTLLHSLQRILLCIHQYKIRMLYKPGPHLFIANWVYGHNYRENRDEEILQMSLNIEGLRNMYRHHGMHDSRRNEMCNSRRWSHKCTHNLCDVWLAINKSWSSTTILVLYRWNSSHTWVCHGR